MVPAEEQLSIYKQRHVRDLRHRLAEKGIIDFHTTLVVVIFVEVKIGDKAPDFKLPTQMGDRVTLSEYFGKKSVVLYFYPKDETTGCTKEACAFRDNYDVFTTLGAEVLGVSGQSVESHKSFASHHGLPFLLLSDADNKVRSLYGVPATMGIIPGRVTYIIDKKGIVRHIFNSQYQPEKHVEEAKNILMKLNDEEKTAAATATP
jgi:peroxiredoxin Q/BCP